MHYLFNQIEFWEHILVWEHFVILSRGYSKKKSRGGYTLTKAEKKKLQQDENLKRLKAFRLMDDDFMTKCFEGNTECTELVLRIVLNKPDLKVESVKIQYFVKNLMKRSVKLDIFATDSNGKRYNIENNFSESQ